MQSPYASDLHKHNKALMYYMKALLCFVSGIEIEILEEMELYSPPEYLT